MHRRRRQTYDHTGFPHFLTFSCHCRHQLLRSERICTWLVESIGDARERLGFKVWAYVIMPEHVHILVHPRDQKIRSILWRIKQPVGVRAIPYIWKVAPEWSARLTRRRGRRTERVFWMAGGGYDRTVRSPERVRKIIGYIHHNPVRRRLVDDPVDWKWSSARWYETGEGVLPMDEFELL